MNEHPGSGTRLEILTHMDTGERSGSLYSSTSTKFTHLKLGGKPSW
jgi:hypothetical protein